jgi:hypothetical protein
MDGQCSTHIGDGQIREKFWLGSLNVRDHWEDIGVFVRIILKWLLGKFCGKVWIGFSWLKVGTGLAL